MEIDPGRAGIDQGQAGIDQGQAGITQGQPGIDQGQAGTDQGQAGTSGIIGKMPSSRGVVLSRCVLQNTITSCEILVRYLVQSSVSVLIEGDGHL